MTSSRSHAGIRVETRDELGIAILKAYRNRAAGLAERIDRLYGAKLPQGRQRAPGVGTAFIGVGPGAWLATCDGRQDTFAETLAREVGDIASVVDQTDAYAVLRIGGPAVRSALCKFIPIDLHPRAFGVGDAAVTIAAHVGVIVWRLDDETSDSPIFELAVPRSAAKSCWEAFSAGAAEFGIGIA